MTTEGNAPWPAIPNGLDNEKFAERLCASCTAQVLEEHINDVPLPPNCAEDDREGFLTSAQPEICKQSRDEDQKITCKQARGGALVWKGSRLAQSFPCRFPTTSVSSCSSTPGTTSSTSTSSCRTGTL